MLRLAVACASLALAACASVPVAPPVSLETLREGTRVLASGEFAGRAPGTIGEERTVAWLVQAFTDAGLQPGNGPSWVQQVPLVEITGSGHAPLMIGDAALTFGSQWVGVSYREIDRVELAPSELVFVGYGINAPERGWNDYAGVDMRGKVALILINDPDHLAEGLDGPFNGRAMTYYGRWSYKFEEAARQGAAAALIVHEDFAASYGWNVVEEGWSGPQAHAARPDGGAGQTLLNGWLQQDAARAVLSAAGQDAEALFAAAARPGFRALPLGVAVSTSFANSIRRYSSANVVGILPGTERPDEYVLHTAHWDHMGHCAPAAADPICHGAVDNATGTAALVALAQAHATAGPTARSQLFLAVTAEEAGLIGSEYYAANPLFPLAATAGGINMDALYMFGPARDVTVIGGGKSELDALLATALAAQGRSATPDPNPQAGRYYRSDHFSLAKRGVPMLYVKSGENLLEGGFQAGAAAYQDYNRNHYHTPADAFDPAWNWDGVLRDVEVFFHIARQLGDSADWPNWLAGDEFRSIRDAACAAPGDC